MKCIQAVVIVLCVMGLQECISTSKTYSCKKKVHRYYKDLSPRALKCFVEKDIILYDNVIKHVDHVRMYLDVLHSQYKSLLKITSEIGNKQEYLKNAMNVFSVLRRAAKDWVFPLRITLNLPVSFNPVNIKVDKMNENYVLEGSSLEQEINLTYGFRGLSRLQSVYHLSADTLANGKLPGALGHTIMTVDDCFEFAKYYYFQELNYREALAWFDQTLKRMDSSRKGRVTEKAVLELYFLAQCFTGDFIGSKLTYNKLIAKYKKFSPSLRVLEDFEIMSRYGCKKAGKVAEGRIKQREPLEIEEEVGIEDLRDAAFRGLKEEDRKLLELCNYPRNVYSETAKLLKCRYVHYNKPLLRIGPFKIEEYHLDPPVLLFHNVISDKEINEIVNYSKPWMRQSLVQDLTGYAVTDEEQRTSESTMLRPHMPISSRLTRRTGMMSSWSLFRVEPFQVASYGPSGAFLSHIDTMPEDAKRVIPGFADYSTIMFFLNDVEKGGHIIFPALNVTVVPVKGSAVLWFNRKPDGTSDDLSLHAGCPILQGSKWILNKWFHLEQQTFPKCTKKRNSSFKYFYL